MIWVEFVVGSLLCSEWFFSGCSGFPPPWKPALPNANSIRNARTGFSECFRIPKCSVGKQIIITIYNFLFRIYAEIEKLRKRKAKQRPSIVRRFSSRRNLSFRRNRSLRKKREGEQDKEVAPKVIYFNTVFQLQLRQGSIAWRKFRAVDFAQYAGAMVFI